MPQVIRQVRTRSRRTRRMVVACGTTGDRRPKALDEDWPTSTRLGAPSGGFLVCANPLLLHCRRCALLQPDLIRQWLVNRPGAIRLNVAEQSGGAVTIIEPARVVGDRIPADAFHRYSECPCLRHLGCQNAQPERSF